MASLEELERELAQRQRSADAVAIEWAEVPEDQVTPAAEIAGRAGYADGYAAGFERALELLHPERKARHLALVRS